MKMKMRWNANDRKDGGQKRRNCSNQRFNGSTLMWFTKCSLEREWKGGVRVEGYVYCDIPLRAYIDACSSLSLSPLGSGCLNGSFGLWWKSKCVFVAYAFNVRSRQRFVSYIEVHFQDFRLPLGLSLPLPSHPFRYVLPPIVMLFHNLQDRGWFSSQLQSDSRQVALLCWRQHRVVLFRDNVLRGLLEWFWR